MLICQKIWDITSTLRFDKEITDSAASESITRKQVKFCFSNLDIIKSNFYALHFENANGGDLFIFPAFIVFADSSKKLGIRYIKEVKSDFIS